MPDCNSPGSRHAGEREIAQAVNDRKGKDRPVFAEPTVGQNRAEDWKEIDAEHEIMRGHVRFVLLHRGQQTGLIQDVVRHEDGQDRLHAVIGETLSRFVADDVRHARRHAR